MTIRHLKIFVTVAECGKMRKAAEILYVSQPTISQAIAELEDYYGIKLFERLSQKIYITDSGKELLEYARHIISSFETMDLAMKHSANTPLLRLGGSVSVGTRFFEQITTELEETMPQLDLRVVINNTESIEQLLLTSKLDVGIVEGNVNSKDLIRLPLCTDELVIVVGTTHPFYDREYIYLSELPGQHYIAREDGSTLRNQFEVLLAERSLSLSPKWSCSNTEAIKNAVIGGKGFAILSKLIVENELKQNLLRVVPIKNLYVKREIQLIYHKDKFISPGLTSLINIAKTTIHFEEN